MTAKEFLKQKLNLQTIYPGQSIWSKDAEEVMIEFAKYHVAEALRAAIQNVGVKEYEESILNAYPLSNIK